MATDNKGASTTSNAALVNITATPQTPQAYYIHTDQLNTPRLITDKNNLAVWRWDNWEPFGNYITDEDPSNTGNKFTFNLRFPGQYYDSETQTHYNYFRDYDPQTGSYRQSDPIGLAGGQFSTYAYVGGKPLSSVDPEGKNLLTVGVGIGVAYSCYKIYNFFKEANELAKAADEYGDAANNCNANGCNQSSQKNMLDKSRSAIQSGQEAVNAAHKLSKPTKK